MINKYPGEVNATRDIFGGDPLNPDQVFVCELELNEFGEPVLLDEKSEDSYLENINRLRHYYFTVVERLANSADDPDYNVLLWMDRLEYSLAENDLKSRYGLAVERFFSKNPNHIIPFLLGREVNRYFVKNETNDLDSNIIWGMRPMDNRVDLSLSVIEGFSDLHFGEDSSAKKILLSASDAESQAQLEIYSELAGLMEDVPNLRIKREGDLILLANYGPDGLFHGMIRVASTEIGLYSITGIDGCGKGTILNELGGNVIEAAYFDSILERAEELGIVEEDEIRLQEMKELVIEAKESGMIFLVQQMLVESRSILKKYSYSDGDQLTLSPFQGMIMERNLFCNIVYQGTPYDFCLMLEEEFRSENVLLPEVIVLLKTEMVEIENRLRARRGMDDSFGFDSEKMEVHANRMMRYLLLSRLFPEIFKVVYSEDQYGDVKTPSQLAREVRIIFETAGREIQDQFIFD